MGLSSRRPPLPAPTDSMLGDSDAPHQPDDLATTISMQSDRTSYSIPDNGDPITIPTGKKSKNPAASQASLLIEYFEGGRSGDKGRPSVRVKVTPSGKGRKAGDAVQITEVGSNRKASHTQRISLGNPSGSRAVAASDASQEDEVRAARQQPVEVEILPNPSEMSSGASRSRVLPVTSDISSMPGDSVLDRPLGFKEPPKSPQNEYSDLGSRGLDESVIETVPVVRKRRSRSLSRERIQKRAAEKARQLEESPEESSRRRVRKSKERTSSKGHSEEDHSRSRRSSKSHGHSYRDSGEYRSGTDSSVRPRDVDSNLSALSSLANNSRLLQTVEDAIRRIVLPEIKEIKRQQSKSHRGVRDSMITESSYRTDTATDLDASAVADTAVRGKERSRDLDETTRDTLKLKKTRHSSGRDGASDQRRRRTSDSSRDVGKTKSSSARRSSKESRDSAGLTTAALRSHDARSADRERRERRKARSKSHSRSDSNSLARTDESSYLRSKSGIPAMPLQSEMEDSELTRESLLSAETAETTTTTERPHSRQIESPLESPVVQQVSRNVPVEVAQPRDAGTTREKSSRERTSRDVAGRDIPTPPKATDLPSPRSARSRSSLKNVHSDRSLNRKVLGAGLIGAGLGGAAAGLYHNTHKKDRSRSRDLSRKASEEREISPVQSEASARGSGAHNQKSSYGVHRADTVSPIREGEANFRHDTMSPMGALNKFSPVGTRDPMSTGTRDVMSPGIRDAMSPLQARDAMSPLDARGGQDTSRSLYSPASTASVQYPVTEKRHQPISLENEEDVLDPHISRETASRDIGTAGYRDSMQTEDSRGYAGGYDSQRNSRALDDYEHRQSLAESIEEHPGDDKVYSAKEVRVIATNPQLVKNPVLVQSETGSLMEPSVVGTPQSASTPNQPFSAQSYKNREQAQEGSGLKNVMLNDEFNESRSRWNLLRENAQARSGSKDTLASSSGAQARDIQADERIPMGASSLPNKHDPMPEIGHFNDDSDSITNPSIKGKPSSVHEGPLGDPNANQDHWPHEPTPPGERRSWADNDEEERYISAGNAALMGAAAGLGLGAAASAAKGPQGARELHQAAPVGYRQPPFASPMTKPISPGNLKDEGYITSDQREQYSPIDLNRSPPKLFGGRTYNESPRSMDDPFVDKGNKKLRHLSNSTQGMSAGYYDAATGTGINNIQSQDIVALMGLLTVRDGQRNARDTQIIHNLVKSAAEARTNFQEVKQLIVTQSNANMKNQDAHTDALLEKMRTGPRPQVLGSPRTPGSVENAPTKKPNFFKRAIQGLSTKSTVDVSRIEDMLVNILGELETLKAANAGLDPHAQATLASLNTFENVQRGPGSGYEPEGQAGTGSTPGNSGFFGSTANNATNQSRIQTGKSTNIESEKRVSTVPEDEDEDRDLRTPVQEHRRQLSEGYATARHDADNFDQSPQTNRSSEERRNRRSTFSYPRMSRWSKTTTTTSSSANNRYSTETTARAERPDSMASQSGEAVNVLPPSGVWNVADDDRLRSTNSLAKEENEIAQAPVNEPDFGHYESPTRRSRELLQDPKYTAQRNSIILQHPQPRAGPTGRHRNHLESQADDYDTDDARSTDSPGDQMLMGSVPALGRLPGGGFASSRATSLPQGLGPMSPLASPRTYQAAAPGPPRPPKIRDDGPLIPPKIAITPQQDQHPHIDRETYGPRGSHSTTSSFMSEEDSVEDHEEHDDPSSEADSAEYPYSPPLMGRRSPYMPGGPLAPIEERYSMEIDRNSLAHSVSVRSGRHSIDASQSTLNPNAANVNSNANTNASLGPGSGSHSRRGSGAFGQLAQVEEETERERSITPNLAPRPAVGAEALGGEARKLTGPREMPGASGSGLRGTVRRKPISGEF